MTVTLSLLSIAISLAVALPVGIYAAIEQDSLADYLARSAAVGALSIPQLLARHPDRGGAVVLLQLGSVDRQLWALDPRLRQEA